MCPTLWGHYTVVLVIYGASLGESDDSWRKRIVDWLLSDENRHLIRVYKYGDSICPKSDTKMIITENQKKRNLAKELKIKDEDLSKCINRIHVPLGNELFNYKKIIEKKYSEEDIGKLIEASY